MKLGIVGGVALVLGIWGLDTWWWFVEDFVKGLVPVGLTLGGALTIAVAARRMSREKTSGE